MGGRTSTYKSLTARTHANNLNSWEYVNSECISKCAALVKSGGKKKHHYLIWNYLVFFLMQLFVSVVQSKMCGISIAQYLLLLVIKRQILFKENCLVITTKSRQSTQVLSFYILKREN